MAPRENQVMIALSFYDHKRQNYGHLPIDHDAEFMVGDYGDGSGGVDIGGEFKIVLLRFNESRGPGRLHPNLRVFGDAMGSLRAALDMGLTDVMRESYATADDFSRALIGIGITDRSDNPIGHRPACPCCGKPTNV